MTISRMIGLAAAIISTGCLAVPPAPVTQSTRQVAASYTLGKRDSAVVGSPVVSVKDYMVRRTTYPGVEPTVPFEMKASRLRCTVAVDSAFGFGPPRNAEGVEYRTVSLPCGWALVVLAIDSVGVPTGEWASEGRGWSDDDLTLSPPSVRFQPLIRESVDPAGGYTNYELLYGGTDGRSFTMTYREYTPDNLIRPAFSQTLTFETGSESIRFRSLRLAVHSVSSEQIVYTVVSDQ